MAFGLGSPWSDSTVGSASRMNLQVCIVGPAADLALLDPTLFTLCKATTTGSGFTLDHVYVARTDGTGWDDISSAQPHTHTGNSDGGLLSDVEISNGQMVDTGARFMFAADKANWTESISSTGSVTNDTDGTTSEKSILLDSGSTSGSRSQITMTGGVPNDFQYRSSFQTKIRIGTLSSMTYRGGIHTDAVTSADSNNEAYGAEVCTATNNNWWVRSAHGTNKSAEDSTVAATTNRVGLKLVHYPEVAVPYIDFFIDDPTTVVYSKTTFVPSAATAHTGARSNIFRHSLKNSTGSSRTVYVYATRVIYYYDHTTNAVGWA